MRRTTKVTPVSDTTLPLDSSPVMVVNGAEPAAPLDVTAGGGPKIRRVRVAEFDHLYEMYDKATKALAYAEAQREDLQQHYQRALSRIDLLESRLIRLIEAFERRHAPDA